MGASLLCVCWYLVRRSPAALLIFPFVCVSRDQLVLERRGWSVSAMSSSPPPNDRGARARASRANGWAREWRWRATRSGRYGRSSGADDARRQQGRRWVRALTDLRFGPRQARVAPDWAADGFAGPAAGGGDRADRPLATRVGVGRPGGRASRGCRPGRRVRPSRVATSPLMDVLATPAHRSSGGSPDLRGVGASYHRRTAPTARR